MTDATPGARAKRHSRLRTALFASVLALSAAPVFAGPGLAGDSADQIEATTSVARALTAPTAQLAQPEMLLASDINQLIAMDVDKPVQADGRVEGLLKRALSFIGTPYRWGGSSPDSGFDCSGLVGYVFRTALGKIGRAHV